MIFIYGLVLFFSALQKKVLCMICLGYEYQSFFAYMKLFKNESSPLF